MEQQQPQNPQNPVIINHDQQHGRTGWDAASSALNSKMLWIFLFSIIGLILIWLLWDTISIIPIYVLSSVFLSLFWYNPISTWLQRQSSFIEVWDKDTNTLTTYMVGKDAFASLKRAGLNNNVQSIIGNNRIFASHFNPDERTLETSWVHDCDPWTYHKERRTLNKLTDRVNEVLHDITVGDMMAQVEGRIHARESMQRHYSDLDSIFFGDVTKGGDDHDIQTPEPHN